MSKAAEAMKDAAEKAKSKPTPATKAKPTTGKKPVIAKKLVKKPAPKPQPKTTVTQDTVGKSVAQRLVEAASKALPASVVPPWEEPQQAPQRRVAPAQEIVQQPTVPSMPPGRTTLPPVPPKAPWQAPAQPHLSLLSTRPFTAATDTKTETKAKPEPSRTPMSNVSGFRYRQL